jgi:hypothetical protein
VDGTFWNIVAFSESTLSELMRLGEGEAMAVQGAMRLRSRSPSAASASKKTTISLRRSFLRKTTFSAAFTP